MAKILYVEDDLAPDTIIRFFGKYISPEENAQLTNLKRREDIKKLFSQNEFVNVEYYFLAAIKAIEIGPSKYSFFIIDRNLESGNRDYSEEGQEGDYLFRLLAKNHSTTQISKFCYYLTAHALEKDSFKKSLGAIYKDIENNIIEKSNPVEEDRLIEIINNHEDLIIQFKHEYAFRAFKYLPEENAYKAGLYKIIRKAENDNVLEDGDTEILRKIYECMTDKIIMVLRKNPKVINLNTLLHQSEKNGRKKDYDELNDIYNGKKGTINKKILFDILHGDLHEDGKPIVKYMPDNVYGLKFFFDCASKPCHHSECTIRMTPKCYLSRTIINMLLDIMVWYATFMSFMNEHDK